PPHRGRAGLPLLRCAAAPTRPLGPRDARPLPGIATGIRAGREHDVQRYARRGRAQGGDRLPGDAEVTVTEPLFQQDAYRRSCIATVIEAGEGGVVLDVTV